MSAADVKCPHGVAHGTPCNDCVICPGCAHQFPATPVNVQAALSGAETVKSTVYGQPAEITRERFVDAMLKVDSPTMTFGDGRALLVALGVQVGKA